MDKSDKPEQQAAPGSPGVRYLRPREGRRSPSVSLPRAVSIAVKQRCHGAVGVSAAWMSRDGTDFVLTGPAWTPELSALGAKLAVELDDCLGREGRSISGGFVELATRPPDWLQVLP